MPWRQVPVRTSLFKVSLRHSGPAAKKSWLGLRIFFVWKKCMDIVKKFHHVFPSGFQAGKFLHLLLVAQMAPKVLVQGE